MYKKALLYSLLLFLMGACSRTVPRISESKADRDMAFLYNPAEQPLTPRERVYHINDSVSQLMVEIKTNELLFNKANPAGKELAQVNIHYRVWETYPDPGRQIRDSATYPIFIKAMENTTRYVAYVPVSAKYPKKYIARIYVHDKLRNVVAQDFIAIDKSSLHVSQNFRVNLSPSGQPLLNPVLEKNEIFSIEHANGYKYNTIFVKYYPNNHPLPPPIFSSLAYNLMEFAPDSLYQLEFSKEEEYTLNDQGVYHFQLDTSVREGLTLYNFGEGYPRFTTPRDLLEPLVYLTSTNEYRDLAESSDIKLAVDNFWYRLTGSFDRARELLRVYYNRGQYANYYFTADREGWKTDRGMVYMVYGPPKSLYKSDNEEKWVYFQKKGSPTLELVFRRYPSPFTNNLFVLEREEGYNSFWREAIETWRDGKPYTY